MSKPDLSFHNHSAELSVDIGIPGLDLIRELGSGASSTVYLARRNSGSGSDDYFAVKILNDLPSASDPRKLSLIRREAVLLARIRHPALVKIMEVGELSGRPYLIMEYIPGS